MVAFQPEWLHSVIGASCCPQMVGVLVVPAGRGAVRVKARAIGPRSAENVASAVASDDVQGGERSVLSGQRAACAAWPCL